MYGTKRSFFTFQSKCYFGVSPLRIISFFFLNKHLGFTSQSKIRVIYILFLSHYSIQTSTEE